MSEMRGITVQVPADLHGKVKAEQELLKQTMSQYIQMVLEEHFNPKQNEKGGTDMNGNNRTLAFQVSEELFQRVKAYLAKHPKLSQKDFIVDLIEQELDRFEKQEARPEHPDIDGTADKSSSEDGVGGSVTPENPPNNGDAAE
ncbi:MULTISPECIES: 4-oxalocrotonate tautomerase [unclassified Dehalobacter]|uniref:4-oxalocrotonate tautomerase n=1 Tax=unclassified Dehalobacter TaxID=2635733 RepID=UPI000EC22E0C|nr:MULTISPECIES: 4-oxalocrotonate tautomerase [unclassified Dehalobacter]RJE46631.1 hypothetical protein A7K50_12770 [Dehalobacter sp. MCB1]